MGADMGNTYDTGWGSIGDNNEDDAKQAPEKDVLLQMSNQRLDTENKGDKGDKTNSNSYEGQEAVNPSSIDKGTKCKDKVEQVTAVEINKEGSQVQKDIKTSIPKEGNAVEKKEGVN